MAGAIARYAKWLYSTPMGVCNLISIMGLPVVVYVLVQQEKEFARIKEQKKFMQKRFDALRARGMIREQ